MDLTHADVASETLAAVNSAAGIAYPETDAAATERRRLICAAAENGLLELVKARWPRPQEVTRRELSLAGGVAVAHFIPWKGLPAVAYIVTLGCIVTIPGFPGSEMLTAYVSKISFIGLCTPILAYAGLAVGKDIDALKSQGWKIVVVGLFVFVGTFIGSAIIAEIVLRMMN